MHRSKPQRKQRKQSKVFVLAVSLSAMSTVTSYTLLSSLAPSRKISRTLRTRKLATAPAVALPLVRPKLSPLSICHAVPYAYDVPPFALVHPKFSEYSPPKSNSTWKITEDADHINLWFKVEETTKKSDLEVTTKGNLLLIRYKGVADDANAASPATKLDVRLLMPAGYDDRGKVEAELTFGSLLVTVTKPKPQQNMITIIGPSDQV